MYYRNDPSEYSLSCLRIWLLYLYDLVKRNCSGFPITNFVPMNIIINWSVAN